MVLVVNSEEQKNKDQEENKSSSCTKTAANTAHSFPSLRCSSALVNNRLCAKTSMCYRQLSEIRAGESGEVLDKVKVKENKKRVKSFSEFYPKNKIISSKASGSLAALTAPSSPVIPKFDTVFVFRRFFFTFVRSCGCFHYRCFCRRAYRLVCRSTCLII